ncbi:MAG: hypothetical protein MUE50_27270, partial [Pirellulaceae bacterium]|nr:hypothetical protein [Pirellulaceae bacterium]
MPNSQWCQQFQRAVDDVGAACLDQPVVEPGTEFTAVLAAEPDPLAGSRQPARKRGLGHPLAVNRGVEPQSAQ